MVNRHLKTDKGHVLDDHAQALRCKASSQRAHAEKCQDPVRRRRYLATALIAEELADYISDTSCLPATFWQRLQKQREVKHPHLRLVINR
jgi:hypothetical protein